MEFFPWEEGLCVQCMHIGQLRRQARHGGRHGGIRLRPRAMRRTFGEGRFHHEIYLQ